MEEIRQGGGVKNPILERAHLQFCVPNNWTIAIVKSRSKWLDVLVVSTTTKMNSLKTQKLTP